MIEVTLHLVNRAVDRAEADTPEDAVFAARTLWDEYSGGPRGFYGVSKSMSVTFHVDGKLVRIVKGRKP